MIPGDTGDPKHAPGDQRLYCVLFVLPLRSSTANVERFRSVTQQPKRSVGLSGVWSIHIGGVVGRFVFAPGESSIAPDRQIERSKGNTPCATCMHACTRPIFFFFNRFGQK